MSNIVVIYHGDCPDGTASAWCVHKKYPNAYFHGTNERKFYMDKERPDITNRDVFILDYSYDSNTIDTMCYEAKSITIIDHHISAYKALMDYENKKVIKIFDMLRSGCTLTYKYLFPNDEIPVFLRYIEDKDIWNWDILKSKEFTSWLYYHNELSFELFDILSKLPAFDPKSEESIGAAINNNIYKTYKNDTISWESIFTRGENALATQNRIILIICEHALKARFKANNRTYIVKVAETGILHSEVGNVLSNDPSIDFSITYTHNLPKKTYNVSLRSTGNFDVSKIAKAFGGGGHKNAAGFAYTGEFQKLFSFDIY